MMLFCTGRGSDQVTFDQKLKEVKGKITEIWGKSVPIKGKRTSKGPEIFCLFKEQVKGPYSWCRGN